MESLSFAHIVWAAAFESMGAITFGLIAATVLLETLILKGLLRTPWDDTFGAVLFSHLVALFVVLVLGIPFTEIARQASWPTIDASGFALVPATLRAIGGTLAVAVRLVPGAGREVLTWPGSGTAALSASVGLTVLIQLVAVRAILSQRWNLRVIGSIVGVGLVTAGAIAMAVLFGAEDGAVDGDVALNS